MIFNIIHLHLITVYHASLYKFYNKNLFGYKNLYTTVNLLPS